MSARSAWMRMSSLCNDIGTLNSDMIYSIWEAGAFSNAETGKRFGLTCSAVSHIVHMSGMGLLRCRR